MSSLFPAETGVNFDDSSHEAGSVEDTAEQAAMPELIDWGNLEIPLNSNRQRWFIRRGYPDTDVNTITEEGLQSIFRNIPYFVRFKGIKIQKGFDTEAHLRRLYLWLQGHTQEELARETGTAVPGVSMKLKTFGRVLSRNFTIDQVISGELPKLPAEKVETPQERFIKRGRIFLALAYSEEAVEPDNLPDEIVQSLVSFLPAILNAHGDTRGSSRQHLNRLMRWLEGEAYHQIAKTEGITRQALYLGLTGLASRVVKALPDDSLRTIIDRAKNGESVQELLEGIGRMATNSREASAKRARQNKPKRQATAETDKDSSEVEAELQVEDVPDWAEPEEGEIDLGDIATEVVVNISRAPTPRRYQSAMTSEQFWKSPIRPPKPAVGRKTFRKQEEAQPPLEVERDYEELKDGRIWQVNVLPGYTGPKSLPEKATKIGDYEITPSGRARPRNHPPEY